MGATNADRITAVILFLVGAAMLYGGFTMDRLEVRQIHPASIPGLVPMILGAALMLCAGLLFRASRPAQPGTGESGSTGNLLIAAALSVFYAVVLVGRVPFVVATAAYITAFILIFTAGPTRWRRVLFAAAFAGIFAAAIAALFRFGFLVRLP